MNKQLKISGFALCFLLGVLLYSCDSKKQTPLLISIAKLEKFATNTSQIVFDKEVVKMGYKFTEKKVDTITGLSTFSYIKMHDAKNKLTSYIAFSQKEKPEIFLAGLSKDEVEEYKEEAQKLGYKEADEIVMSSKFGTWPNSSNKYYESATFYFSIMETVEYGMVQVWRK